MADTSQDNKKPTEPSKDNDKKPATVSAGNELTGDARARADMLPEDQGPGFDPFAPPFSSSK